jgi:hypothetical protein
MWYTGENLASFMRNMVMDVARSSVIIPEAEKDRIESVGLEHFASHALIQDVRMMRNRHRLAVFGEHARQKCSNNHDAEVLARVSTGASEWARMRSQDNATSALGFRT